MKKTLKSLPLIISLAFSLILPGLGYANPAENSNVEKIKVTGSRIKRIDIEGVNPVVVYSKEDLENSGYSSVGDFLRDTTASHFGVSREEAGSSASGESSVSLKGETSLVLINGLRVVEDPTTGTVDLNLIPFYALERVEILQDGGSALYGSDAIGGVINFITKKDFSGAEIHAQISPVVYPWYKGDSEKTMDILTGSIKSLLKKRSYSGSRADAAGVFGGTHKKGSYIGVIYARFQDSVDNYEREWTAEMFSPIGPYAVWTAEMFSPIGPYYAVFNNQVDPNCPDELKTSDGCKYNYANDSTRLPRHSQIYGFFQGDYKKGDTKFYSQLITSVKNVKWDFAPIPGGLQIPAGHQMSLGAGQKGVLKYRFMEAGRRDTTYNSFIGDLTVGAKGWLSPTWDYDASLKLAHIIKNETGGGLLLKEELSQAIANGLYDPFNPEKRDLSTALYTAESGNDSTLISGSLDFSGSTKNWNLATGVQAYFKNYDQNADENVAQGKILSNAGGDGYGDRYVASYYMEGIKTVSPNLEIQLAGRLDYYNDSVSPDQPGEEASENKRHSVNRWTLNPKLAFRFKPHSQLLLRGSLSTAFVAPSLEALNQSVSEGFPFLFDTVACFNQLESKNAFETAYSHMPAEMSQEEKTALAKDFLIEQKDVIKQKNLSPELKTEFEKLSSNLPKHDYCKERQVFTKSEGNKNLEETQALVASLGSHLQITDEHSLTLDLWHIRKSGIPSYGLNKKTVDAELKYGVEYVQEKSKESITIKRQGGQYNPLHSTPEHGITSKLLNLSSSQISGLDLKWNSDISRINLWNGRPYFQNRVSFIISSSVESFPGIGYVDNIGKWGAPRWRNIATLGWKNKKHNVSFAAHTVSPFAKETSELENLPMYTRLDLDYQFMFSTQTSFKFGWSNLLFSTPPRDTEAPQNQIVHNIFESRGPFVFAGLKHKF